MNNVKKLMYIFLFLVITVIFQIIVVIRLNHINGQADKKLTLSKEKETKINTTAAIEDKTSSDSDTENNNPETATDVPVQDEYLDFDEIIADENLKNIFENSLLIGDSRTDAIRKFSNVGNYADFCCDIGINISKITTNTFYIRQENIFVFDAISKYKYDKIFIALGYNELGWKYEDSFIEKYATFIDNIKSLSPNTKIYVQSILHISDNASVANEFENNARIDLYNRKISELCALKGVNYIDLNSYFTDENGNLLKEAATDGIHFNSEYCLKYLYRLINSI